MGTPGCSSRNGLTSAQTGHKSPTNWGSRQNMIQWLLEQEKANTQVLATDRSTKHLVQMWKDVEILDFVNKTLGPLLEFTDVFSAKDYVAISCMKPFLQFFSNNIPQAKENDRLHEDNQEVNTGLHEEQIWRHHD